MKSIFTSKTIPVFLLLLISHASFSQCWNQVSCYNKFSAGIKNDGTLWTWGDKQYGQLGIVVDGVNYVPQQVGNSHEWKQVAVGGRHVIALRNDNTVWSWGGEIQQGN